MLQDLCNFGTHQDLNKSLQDGGVLENIDPSVFMADSGHSRGQEPGNGVGTTLGQQAPLFLGQVDFLSSSIPYIVVKLLLPLSQTISLFT